MEYQTCVKEGGSVMNGFYNPNDIDPPDEKYYICPCCGAELCCVNKVYLNEDREIIGCEECITTKYAEDVL